MLLRSLPHARDLVGNSKGSFKQRQNCLFDGRTEAAKLWRERNALVRSETPLCAIAGRASLQLAPLVVHALRLEAQPLRRHLQQNLIRTAV